MTRCKYYSSPSYRSAHGCLHPAWPQNRACDFEPTVECGGDQAQCELTATRCWSRYRGGLTRRVNNCQAKMGRLVREQHEAEELEKAGRTREAKR